MSVTITITIPEEIVEKVRKLGMDLESFIFEVLLRELKLDPEEEVQMRLQLVNKFFNEGLELVDKNPVQASEKLYKVVEECVKILAIKFNITEVLESVRSRGRWTVTDLEKTVRIISKMIGKWFLNAWDSAWTLHVWGFHEAKLSSEAVKDRVEFVKKIMEEAVKLVHKK